MRTTFASESVRGLLREDETDNHGRTALFLDVDGTLLDLAERPEAVSVPPKLVASLAAAQAKTRGALALISGRKIADLDGLFAPLRFRAAGVHGAELRLDPDDAPSATPVAGALPAALWARLNRLLDDFPGTFAEDKRYSFAVHYRQSPDVGDALRRRLTRLIETDPRPGIMMLEAHCAFELKSQQFDKGRAIAAFLATPPFQGRMPIFIGDDDTDEAGFAVVSARGGRAYSVGRRRPGVVATFARPSDVRGWLAAFVDGLASA